MAAIKVPHSVGDYAVLTLAPAPTKSYPVQAHHYLYVRPNAPKLPTPTTARELFLANIPVDTTPTHIRTLFTQHLGGFRIESIGFGTSNTDSTTSMPAAVAGKKRKRRGPPPPTTGTSSWPATTDRPLHAAGETAVVLFVDEASATGAMKAVTSAAKARTALPWEATGVPALGRARYSTVRNLMFPPAAELQASVDAYMAAFEAAETERAKALAKARSVPDEDGFVTVTRGGRNKPARIEEAQAKLEKQKEKHKGREDFYRFQMRERRKDEAKKLQRGFEEERRRVHEMRGKRKYRPE